MGHTACTEPQCLYKGALYLYICKISEGIPRLAFVVITIREHGSVCVLRWVIALLPCRDIMWT